LAAQDERVKFLSGFSGSNAFAIIGKSEAFLWTDGRYFDQVIIKIEINGIFYNLGHERVAKRMDINEGWN
jgi:hypothetical protein